MSEHPTNSEFLIELAKGAAPDEWLWVNHFDGNPNGSGNWLGEAYGVSTQWAGVVDTWAHSNTYVAACSLKVKGKVCRRTKDHFGRLLHLPVDDVNPDDLLATPSYVLETSPGNFQAGYFIDGDDPDAANERLVSAVLVAMAAKGLVSVDKSGNNAVRYTRLPVGQNQKPRDGGHWDVRVTHWAPEVRYSLEDAAAAVGIDLDALKAGPVKPAAEGDRQAGAGSEGVGAWTADIIAGTGLHDSINRLAGHQVALGVPPGGVVDMLRSLMSACTGPRDARWQARYDDIGRAVDTAVAKFSRPAATYVIPEDLPPAPISQDLVLHKDVMNPGGMMQVFINWVNETSPRPQPVLALSAACALFGTVLGQKVMSTSGLRTNVYQIGVGLASSGKESARERAVEVLTAAGMGKQQLSKVASGSALNNHLGKQPVTLMQPDEYGMELRSTREQKGGPKADLAQIQMEMFSKAGQIVPGPVYANSRERPQVDIHYPCLSINATTTPETLWEALAEDDITSGFLNRFMVFFAPEGRPYPGRPPKIPPPEELVDWCKAVQELCGPAEVAQDVPADGEHAKDNLQGITPAVNPAVMGMDPATEKLADDLTALTEKRLNAGDADGTAGLWGRTVEHVWKYSMLFECCKHTDAKELLRKGAAGELKIEQDSWSLAQALVVPLTEHLAREAGAKVGQNAFAKMKDKVVKFVISKGAKGASLPVIVDRVRALQGMDEKVQLSHLNTAVKNGLLAARMTELQPGHPAMKWFDPRLEEE